jgi:hypothetical protein
MVGTASRWAPTAEQDLDREIDEIARALDERGPSTRAELNTLVGARYWGPGRFSAALREAVDGRRASRLSRDTFAPVVDSRGRQELSKKGSDEHNPT